MIGVLPPVAKLTPDKACSTHAGYTQSFRPEAGVKEPQATFSTCFGAPFFRWPESLCGNAGRRLREHDAQCWLVNTGWQGGPYGVGKRMDIPYTRAMVDGAVEAVWPRSSSKVEPSFGLHIPITCPGVPSRLLNPRNSWADKAAYDRAGRRPLWPLRQELRTIRCPGRSPGGRTKIAEVDVISLAGPGYGPGLFLVFSRAVQPQNLRST